MKTISRTRKRPVSRDEVIGATTAVGRICGFQIKADRLDPEEQSELVALTMKLTGKGEPDGEGSGWNFLRLAKGERDRWEHLVEKAAAKPMLFADRRKEEDRRTKLHDLAVRARRAPARPKLEERGCVVPSKQSCFDFLRGPRPVLWPAHLALLVYLESCFENGESLSRLARIEGTADDPVYVFDHLMGFLPASLDPEGYLTHWKPLLEHLEVNSFIAVERSGREWRIRRGKRALAALKRRGQQ